MKLSAREARSRAAQVMKYIRLCSRYLREFLGVVKRILGDFKRRGMEIGQNSVRTLVNKLDEIKRRWGGRESSKELDEPELGSVSKEDVMKINKLLTFMAQGGLYGTLLAFLGISIASLYAGWMGMAVIMLVIGVALFLLGSKKLASIIRPDEKKPKIAWKVMLLALGFFFLAIASMGLIDLLVDSTIPRPGHDPYWWLEGIIGLVLLAIAVWLFRVKAKQQ